MRQPAAARVRRDRVRRLGAPAGRADGPGGGRAGARRWCCASTAVPADGRRADRRRRPRLGAGGELRRRDRLASVAERAAARRRGGARRARPPRRVRRPARRDVAGLLLPGAGAARRGARSSAGRAPALAAPGGPRRASTRAPRRWSGPTTSPRSRRPRPSTCGSRATCSAASGGERRATASCSSSGSRRTRSCAT